MACVMCLQLGEQPCASLEALTRLVLQASRSVADNRRRGSARLGSAPGRVQSSGGGAEQVVRRTCASHLPDPLTFGQSTSWHPTGRGSFWPQWAPWMVTVSVHPQAVCSTGQTQVTSQLGDVPCSLKNTPNVCSSWGPVSPLNMTMKLF